MHKLLKWMIILVWSIVWVMSYRALHHWLFILPELWQAIIVYVIVVIGTILFLMIQIYFTLKLLPRKDSWITGMVAGLITGILWYVCFLLSSFVKPIDFYEIFYLYGVSPYPIVQALVSFGTCAGIGIFIALITKGQFREERKEFSIAPKMWWKHTKTILFQIFRMIFLMFFVQTLLYFTGIKSYLILFLAPAALSFIVVKKLALPKHNALAGLYWGTIIGGLAGLLYFICETGLSFLLKSAIFGYWISPINTYFETSDVWIFLTIVFIEYFLFFSLMGGIGGSMVKRDTL